MASVAIIDDSKIPKTGKSNPKVLYMSAKK